MRQHSIGDRVVGGYGIDGEHNGDVGTVIAVDADAETVEVDWDRAPNSTESMAHVMVYEAIDAQSADRQMRASCRARRMELGITQPILAETVGVTQGNLSEWERDLRSLPPDTVSRIVAALGGVYVAAHADWGAESPRAETE